MFSRAYSSVEETMLQQCKMWCNSVQRAVKIEVDYFLTQAGNGC